MHNVGGRLTKGRQGLSLVAFFHEKLIGKTVNHQEVKKRFSGSM